MPNKKIKTKALVKLPKLIKTSLVEIIAPGSAAPEKNLKQGAEVLRSWGYNVIYSSKLLKPKIFLANTDEMRFETFKNAITNPKVNIIWCLRGGYGAIRLLPFIEKMKVPKIKKLFIGLSDVSSLHAIINQKWGWPTLHASLVDRLALNQLTQKNIFELQACLSNPNHITEFSNLKPINSAAKNKKLIKSSVVGGNLVVVTSTLGTKNQINAKNKILFFEEISERSYKVDRCLQQLKQAGVFKFVKAVVIGDFHNCNEPDGKNYIDTVLKDFFKDFKFPVFSGIETGHAEVQRPLFFNTKAHLTCGAKPKMLVYSAFNTKQESSNET